MLLTNKQIHSFHTHPTIPSFTPLDMCSSRLETVRIPDRSRKDREQSCALQITSRLCWKQEREPRATPTSSDTRAALSRRWAQRAEHLWLWTGTEKRRRAEHTALGKVLLAWVAQDAVGVTSQVFPSRCFTQSHPSSWSCVNNIRKKCAANWVPPEMPRGRKTPVKGNSSF